MRYTSNRIDLVKVSNGTDGQKYFLKTNCNEIRRYYESNGNVTFSPEALIINATDEKGKLLELELNRGNYRIEVSFYDLNGSTPSSLTAKLQRPQTEDNEFDFNRFYLNIESLSNDSTLQRIKDSSGFIEIIFYSPEDDILASSYLPLGWALSTDYAQFFTTAQSIQASVQDAGFEFTSEGLKVRNGKITIVDKSNAPVFDVNTNGDLEVIGVIKAKSGTIDGELLLSETGVIQTQGFNEGSETGFKINGQDGSITLNKAIIGSTLSLGGNCTFYGGENERILEITQNNNSIFSIGRNGVLQIGNVAESNYIQLNGAEGSISSQNYSDGTGWKISNNEAIFNNIVARGSIKTAVFEYGEIQAVGGIILVRPSSIIKTMEEVGNKTAVTVENIGLFEEGEYCRVQIESDFKVFRIENIKDNKIIFDTFIDSSLNLVGKALISFGKEDDVNPSYAIGINSSDNSASVPQKAISLNQIKVEKRDIKMSPKIILGYIPQESTYGSIGGSYGLYADNVLVRGQLVSETSQLSSGINTKSKNDAGNDEGNILLWCGAPINNEQIVYKDAPFYVTSKGYMHAKEGRFQGTIVGSKIESSEISAATINTATIIGNGKGTYGLTLNSDKALRFINDNVEHLTLGYNTSNQSELNLNGTLLRIENTKEEGKTDYLRLKENEISFNNKMAISRNNTELLVFNDDIEIKSDMNFWDSFNLRKVIENNQVIGFDLEFFEA